MTTVEIVSPKHNIYGLLKDAYIADFDPAMWVQAVKAEPREWMCPSCEKMFLMNIPIMYRDRPGLWTGPHACEMMTTGMMIGDPVRFENVRSTNAETSGKKET